MPSIKPQIFIYQEKSIDFSCIACSWLPASAKFSVLGTNARDEGLLHVYLVAPNALKLQQEIKLSNAARCCTMQFNDQSQACSQIAIGARNGRLEFRDLGKAGEKFVDIKAHDNIINCIDSVGGRNGPCEIVTGSKDGLVKLWDPRYFWHQ